MDILVRQAFCRKSGETGMTDFTGVLFDEDFLYSNIRDFAKEKDLLQTQASLPFAVARHRGQFRDSRDNVPYIVHPMQIAFHAIALGLWEDDLLATCLLHDVCEDCGVSYVELPAGERVMKAVELLTKTWEHGKESPKDEKAYYQAISEDPIASMVKLLDRCNNVSSMAGAFSTKRIERYMEETRIYYEPLVKKMLADYPQYTRQILAASYQICSVAQALERMLKNGS